VTLRTHLAAEEKDIPADRVALPASVLRRVSEVNRLPDYNLHFQFNY